MDPLFGDTQLVNGGLDVGFAWAQGRRWELLLVGGVGEGLGFEAKSGAVIVDLPALAFGAIEEVSSVKLNAGLCRLYDESPPACGFRDDRGDTEFPIASVFHDVVVIIAFTVFQLFVILLDSLADGGGYCEIERGSLDRGNAGRDGGGVDGVVAVGVDLNFVIEDRFTPFSGEIEVAVIGEVKNGWLVGGGIVVDPEGVVLGPGVGDGACESAGVAALAVGAGVGQGESWVVAIVAEIGFPDLFIETLFSAVEMVGGVVGGEGVFLAIQSEFPFRNAVGVATGDATKIGALFDVVVDGIESEDDVPHRAILVWHDQRGHGSSVIRDGDFCSGLV